MVDCGVNTAEYGEKADESPLFRLVIFKKSLVFLLQIVSGLQRKNILKEFCAKGLKLHKLFDIMKKDFAESVVNVFLSIAP